MGAVFRKHPKQEQPVPRSQVQTEHPAQGFDPRHLSTELLVWCRADAGVETNGSTVSGWRDMSGRGRDFSQATASEQPALSERGLGRRPELTFDGSDDALEGSSLYGMLSDVGEWTIIVICRGWTWGATYGPTWGTAHGRAVMGAPSDSGSYFSLVVGNSSQGPTSGFYPDGAPAPAVAPADSAGDEGADLVWVAVSDGDLVTRINGEAGSVVSAGDLNALATTLAVGHGTSQTAHWDGAISEVLIFDGVLRQNELASLEDYLSDRYSVRMAH
jgi:hypothetical protein